MSCILLRISVGNYSDSEYESWELSLLKSNGRMDQSFWGGKTGRVKMSTVQCPAKVWDITICTSCLCFLLGPMLNIKHVFKKYFGSKIVKFAGWSCDNKSDMFFMCFTQKVFLSYFIFQKFKRWFKRCFSRYFLSKQNKIYWRRFFFF